MDIKESLPFKILRIIFGAPLALVFCIASFYQFYSLVKISIKFAQNGLYGTTYIAREFTVLLFLLSILLLVIRFLLADKLRESISYGKVRFVIALSFLCAISAGIADEVYIDDFKWCEYIPYVEDMPEKFLYKNVEVDYSADRIYITCDEPFIKSAFEHEDVVEVVYDEKYADSMKIDIYYRGTHCESYLDYDGDDVSITMWPDDYTAYDMTDDDIVYMYKTKNAIEYAERFALERIVIFTAYPSKIDTKNIGNG